MSVNTVPSFGTQFYYYPCLQRNNPPPSSSFVKRPVTPGTPAIGNLLVATSPSYCTTFLPYIFSGDPHFTSSLEPVFLAPYPLILLQRRREGVDWCIIVNMQDDANIGATPPEPRFSELTFAYRSDFCAQRSILGMLYPFLRVGLMDMWCHKAQIAKIHHFDTTGH